MAFYTPTWIRRLVKEDHSNIEQYLAEDTRNDFRSYIDASTPFVLWLEIGLLRERILNKPETRRWIEELADSVSVSSGNDLVNAVTDILDKAYIATINKYATNSAYKKIDSKTLEDKLTALTLAPIGNIKTVLDKEFSNTMVVTDVTKKNKSVMLIFRRFNTLRFGEVFKECLENEVKKNKVLQGSTPTPMIGGMFGQLAASSGSDDSEKARMMAFVDKNFKKLQNIGHVEVDVVSEAERKVMRSQNSPRLLQALVSIPSNDPAAFQRLQLKFSKETGQAKTRVKVRKKFAGSKLVFELLVEHGLSVGIPETQKENLDKAKLERAFNLGAGLSATLRKDISILAQLETSKSIHGYLQENVVSILSTGKEAAPYSSDTVIEQVTKVAYTKVKLDNKLKSSSAQQISKGTSKKLDADPQLDLMSLQSFINTHLQDMISANMGDGSSRDVLNYRTGRFAGSVKVERMSKSREGMITAFYSYMKNPYATFSEGGKQEIPKSRDPKLLISRSIRELAAEKVANRLRAVVV